MNPRHLLACLITLAAMPALAAGSHGGGHGDGQMSAIGEPGQASEVARSIRISMLETDDGNMVFEPSTLQVEEGETVRLNFVNAGELEHEFVMGKHADIMQHKAEMQGSPEMGHDDPNTIRLQPGEEGDIVWTFGNAGEFDFACLIPGHYELGMKGDIKVADDEA